MHISLLLPFSYLIHRCIFSFRTTLGWPLQVIKLNFLFIAGIGSCLKGMPLYPGHQENNFWLLPIHESVLKFWLKSQMWFWKHACVTRWQTFDHICMLIVKISMVGWEKKKTKQKGTRHQLSLTSSIFRQSPSAPLHFPDPSHQRAWIPFLMTF